MLLRWDQYPFLIELHVYFYQLKTPNLYHQIVDIDNLNHKKLTPAAAYSLLAFNLLCAPCFAAIGAIHREMNAKKWTWIAIGYQCGLAYLVSFVIYQLGSCALMKGCFKGFSIP